MLSQAQVTNVSKSHQQVEDEEIQEIVSVKSEPHETSQQPINVAEGAVALGESVYEDGAPNIQYSGDDTGKALQR